MNKAQCNHEFIYRQVRDHFISAHQIGSYFVPKKHQDRYKAVGSTAVSAINVAEVLTRPASNGIYKTLNI